MLVALMLCRYRRWSLGVYELMEGKNSRHEIVNAHDCGSGSKRSDLS